MARSTAHKPINHDQPANGKALPKLLAPVPFTLIFLDAAKNVPEGTEQHIKASYVRFGRDSDCLICYGEEFPMVSRLHAVIEWDNDSYSLRHLSKTNQTLLNGRPVTEKWYLHDNDVIQLSPSGPKVRFKMPSPQPVSGQGKKNRVEAYQVALVVVLLFSFLLLLWVLFLSGN